MPRRRIDDEMYDALIDCYRQGMNHHQAARTVGISWRIASKYYRFGKSMGNGKSIPGTESRKLPISVIIKQEQDAARGVVSGELKETIPQDAFMGAIERSRLVDEDPISELKTKVQMAHGVTSATKPSFVIPVDEIPKNVGAAGPLWYRQGNELRIDTKAVKEALQEDKEAIIKEMSESMRDTIISQTTETISAVEDRLDSIRYARAVKGMLAQQAPMVKKAITIIGSAIEDIGQELPSLPTMQKVNVLQRVSGYISTWQTSVEAAIRLERLLLGEPESHVAVTEMSQEDALKKLERLKMLAEQAKHRVVSDS